MTDRPGDQRETAADDPRSARLQAVVDDYLARCTGDQSPAIDDLLREHADLLPELAERLRDAELIRRAVRDGAAEPLAADAPPPTAPLDIPGYDIVSEIHRGGQGIVYLAMQKSTGRQVAVKVLRRGERATLNDRARFGQEARVLGALRHPNIVAIHDSGVIGANYFLVMDYIEGVSLDEHFRDIRLSVRDTLTLFLKICDAINAAHLRGVIHRDIKPSNIRVDATGQPHVLDFGLAKLTQDESTEQITEAGQFLGSMPWASPEQLDLNIQEIDLRTDVYALGVVLYHMLTAHMPYPVDGHLRQVIDNVLFREPVRPSTLRREIDDEVETIILRCLAKTPDRRYDTAGELARDIRRYLAGEPIEAKRDSGAYILRKVLWRYRYPAVAVVVAALFLGASTIALGTLYRSQTRERQRAEAALAREAEQRQLAEQRAAETKMVAKFQAEVLSGIDPAALGRQLLAGFRAEVRTGLQREWVGEWPDRRRRSEAERADELADFDRLASLAYPADVAREVVSSHMLDPAAQAAEERFTEQPLVLGELHAALGSAYQALGKLTEAETHFRGALACRTVAFGEGSPEVDRARKTLGALLMPRGEFDEAQRLFDAALASREFALSTRPDDAEILTDLADLRGYRAVLYRLRGDLDQAEELHLQALEGLRETRNPQDPRIAAALTDLADLRQAQGDYPRAEQLYREALKIRREVLPPNDTDIAASLNNLAAIRWDQGDPAEAEKLLRESLDIYRQSLGNEHVEVASTLMNLAVMRQSLGDFDESEELHRRVLDMLRRLLGDDHPDVATCLNNLGELLVARGAITEGEQFLREALVHRREIFGEKSEPVSSVLNNLATAAFRSGRMDEAETWIRQAIAIDRAVFGDQHPNVFLGLSNLGALLKQAGDPAKAESSFVEALRLAREIEQDHLIIIAEANLGWLYLDRDDIDHATPLFREALTLCMGPDAQRSPRTALIQAGMARCLIHHGDFEKAEDLLLAARPVLDDAAAPPTVQASVRESLVALYEAWHRAEPDAGHDKSAAQWRKAAGTPPEDDPSQ